MSRTFGEHHPVAHNPKNRFPSPYLDNEVKKRDEEKDVLMALKDGKDGEEKYTSKDLGKS